MIPRRPVFRVDKTVPVRRELKLEAPRRSEVSTLVPKRRLPSVRTRRRADRGEGFGDDA
jgi:hypothetical protein